MRGSSKRKRGEGTVRERYLDGLKRFKSNGVKVLIDGREEPEQNWNRLFKDADDGGFYMGDFIAEPGGAVREIRFEKVYMRTFEL